MTSSASESDALSADNFSQLNIITKSISKSQFVAELVSINLVVTHAVVEKQVSLIVSVALDTQFKHICLAQLSQLIHNK